MTLGSVTRLLSSSKMAISLIGHGFPTVPGLRGPSTGLHKLLYNKYYVDEIYQAAIVGPLVWLSRNILWKLVDAGIIDGTVNGVAHGAAGIGDVVRHAQSGNTRSYAVWVIFGALVIFAIVFWPLLHPAVVGGVR